MPRKLGLVTGAQFGVVRAPAAFSRALGQLPDGVIARTVGRGKSVFDVITCFVTTKGELERDVPALKGRLAPAGGLWVAWPKKTRPKTREASGMPTELSESEIRACGLAAGLVDNKVCAIDETWSGLRFVFRLADRGARRAAR